MTLLSRGRANAELFAMERLLGDRDGDLDALRGRACCDAPRRAADPAAGPSTEREVELLTAWASLASGA